jgi:hypothetical protein
MPPLTVYDSTGTSRYIEKSDGMARLYFKDGTIPTEVLINGKRPGVTEATLKKIAPGLKARRTNRE